MAGGNPKGTGLDPSYYELPETIACFESIRGPLLAELQPQQRDISFDARDLSVLTGQLQQFQADFLGIHNRPANAPLRIPAKLFKLHEKRRLSKESPLYTILLAAFTYRISNSWRKWDFTNPSKKSKNSELIQFIRSFLIRTKIIIPPRIAFADSMSEATKKALVPLARKIEAQVVDKVKDATHVLYGQLHQYGGSEEEWFRTLEKKDSKVLVHWWYHPDSYDNWLVQTDQFADPEEAPDHDGPWHIIARWLQDSVKFNELMNEEDYEELEVDSPEPEQNEGRRTVEPQSDAVSVTSEMPSSSVTDVLELVSAPPLPVLNKGHEPEVRIRDIESERPQLGSRQRKNEFEPYSNGDITNISQYTETYIEYPKRPAKKRKLNESTTQNSDASADTTKEASVQKADIAMSDISAICQSAPYDYDNLTMPSWFDISTVHAIEKLSLPEFFKDESDKGMQEYKLYRDYMIQAYQANPDYYLTVAACKAKFDIDLVVLVRIHSFLELNGLINSQVDPRRRIFDPCIDSEPDAGVRTKSQRDFKNVENVTMQYLRDLIFDSSLSASAKSAWDVKIEDPINPDKRKYYSCTNCNVDCSTVRYQSLKYKDVQVCINCFLEGRFTATTSSGDFLRVEDISERDMTEDDWNEEETLRLLEGIERYDDNWMLISEHVGTRSKEQCITQFLQLPITDEFLAAQTADKELEELPFGNHPNPVMTMIAFLSGHINPGVGSAAAKTALKELLQSDDAKNNHVEAEEKEAEEEEIDIDAEDQQHQQSGAKEAFSKQTMKRATTAALQSAVEQARKLASYEEEEIQHWTRLAVKTLIDKLCLKVQQYEELENSLGAELAELDKQRAVLQSSIDALSKKQFVNSGSSFGTDQ
ncbi:hypothetical protein EC973_001369 [Apophysomyces ossiformis]|uniref:SWIRM-domain-containing protein n=1 Tax=Apophysomyces ossiformis TaxID=679940 RepID=A0A8H7BWR3_9FUNG|nr:hypothetical protein EC973_001369 [Apophysomyces ossiformis]